jgi:hypothetical protein
MTKIWRTPADEEQGAVYGKCIAANYQNVSKDMCAKEFMMLKDCYLVGTEPTLRTECVSDCQCRKLLGRKVEEADSPQPLVFLECVVSGYIGPQAPFNSPNDNSGAQAICKRLEALCLVASKEDGTLGTSSHVEPGTSVRPPKSTLQYISANLGDGLFEWQHIQRCT